MVASASAWAHRKQNSSLLHPFCLPSLLAREPCGGHACTCPLLKERSWVRLLENVSFFGGNSRLGDECIALSSSSMGCAGRNALLGLGPEPAHSSLGSSPQPGGPEYCSCRWNTRTSSVSLTRAPVLFSSSSPHCSVLCFSFFRGMGKLSRASLPSPSVLSLSLPLSLRPRLGCCMCCPPPHPTRCIPNSRSHITADCVAPTSSQWCSCPIRCPPLVIRGLFDDLADNLAGSTD